MVDADGNSETLAERAPIYLWGRPDVVGCPDVAVTAVPDVDYDADGDGDDAGDDAPTDAGLSPAPPDAGR